MVVVVTFLGFCASICASKNAFLSDIALLLLLLCVRGDKQENDLVLVDGAVESFIVLPLLLLPRPERKGEKGGGGREGRVLAKSTQRPMAQKRRGKEEGKEERREGQEAGKETLHLMRRSTNSSYLTYPLASMSMSRRRRSTSLYWRLSPRVVRIWRSSASRMVPFLHRDQKKEGV